MNQSTSSLPTQSQYKKERPVGSVLASTTCHYCGGKANTEDHIVPRCDLTRAG